MEQYFGPLSPDDDMPKQSSRTRGTHNLVETADTRAEGLKLWGESLWLSSSARWRRTIACSGLMTKQQWVMLEQMAIF